MTKLNLIKVSNFSEKAIKKKQTNKLRLEKHIDKYFQ